MSRTRHNLPFHSLQAMKVLNRKKAESSALDELKENCVPFRHVNRLTSFMSIIPDPWDGDDKPCAAWKEYHNKNRSFAQNDGRWKKTKQYEFG